MAKDIFAEDFMPSTQPSKGTKSKDIFAEDFVPSAPAAPVKRQYTFLETFPAAASNIGASAEKFYGGVKEAIMNPVQTGKSIAYAGQQLMNYMTPEAYTEATGAPIPLRPFSAEEKREANRFMSQMKNAFLDRYGGYEEAKRTFAEDPVGFAADLSTFFSAGATAAPKASVAASTLNKLSRISDPMNLPIMGVKVAGKSGVAITDLISNVLDPKSAALMESAGDKAPEILNALANVETFVPGSKPLVSQAVAPARSGTFTAFAESAERVPGVGEKALQRRMEQTQAQREALRTIAGEPGQLESQLATRKAQSAIDYPEAFRDMVRADPTLGQLFNDPYIQRVVPSAEELTKSRGITFKTSPIQYLHDVKTRMDRMITDEPDKIVAEQMLKKRDELVDWMITKSPNYKKARDTFAKNSEGIDQMKVGQALEDKLVPMLLVDEADLVKLKGNEFGTALENAPATLKKSTGFARYKKLTDVMTPDQVKTLEGIRDDLARDQVAKTLATAGRKAGALDMRNFVKTYTDEIKGPSLVRTSVALTNDILKRVKGQMNEKLAVELAEAMLDPSTAAEALKKAMGRDKRVKMITGAIQKTQEGATKALRAVPPASFNALGAVQEYENQNQNALRSR
jgi:hypothetical protein